MTKNKHEIVKIGVGFYKKEQWDLFKSLASDSEILEDTFEEWLEIYNDATKNIKKTGMFSMPIEVDVLEMHSWCINKGIAFDAKARSRYIAEKTKELDQQR